MKKKYRLKLLLLFFLIFVSFSTRAQQVNTLYFMDNIPSVNYLNPAFQPHSSFYFGLPVVGFSNFSFFNNSLSIGDIVYNQNGQTILFKNPNADYNKFYSKISSPWVFSSGFRINLIDFGFRSGKSFWSFSVNERSSMQLSIPKDFVKLLLYGTPDINTNYFDLKNLTAGISLYTEAGLGYSRKVSDNFMAGLRLKLNYGTANLSNSNQNADLNASVDQWSLNANGLLHLALPINVNLANNFSQINLQNASLKDFVQPIGLGGGLDIGFSWQPVRPLQISASLTDLGFIRWMKNVKNVSYSANYTLDGLGNYGLSSFASTVNLADSVLQHIKGSASNQQTTASYITKTTPTLNFGAEWGFWNNKLSLGLLSRTSSFQTIYSEEITASINGRPAEWLNMSLSYSFMNGRMNNIGAGIGLRTGIFHWMISADYVPLTYAALPLNLISNQLPSITLPVGYNTSGMNIAIGFKIVIGPKKDTDGDGVVDKRDKCPDTPKGVKVDKNGCPIDSDGDGVPDYLDKCPDTPKGVKVDKNGCPIDSDGDGVPDYLDKCPDTPKGVKVDKNGCPIDSDGDGVPDYLDKCPDTPKGVKVDKNGCPIDSDGDGVPDYLDKCPDTPKGVKVDQNGCPEKVAESKTDVKPLVKPTVHVETKPVLSKEIQSLMQKALQGVQFETGSDQLQSHSLIILNQIAGVMVANPTYFLDIRGFTDNVGNEKANKILSQKRADAVKRYLVRKGISTDRMTAIGFGEANPVASNKTSIGRSLNRRVEFIASYHEITFE